MVLKPRLPLKDHHRGGVVKSFTTTYEPLISTYAKYASIWSLCNDELLSLKGTFKDPWEDIHFEPRKINYTKEQADAKVDYVRNGLESDPCKPKDFHYDSLKLEAY